MGMKRPLQASTFNILGEETPSKSITRNTHQEIFDKFTAVEWDSEALDALIEKYPDHAGRHYKSVLNRVIELVNEKSFPRADDEHKDEVLRGLLAGLVDTADRSFWLLVIHSLSHAPLTNLSRCQVCDKFFLRVRKDQKCCSRNCSNLFRVRKWRESYQEKYKQQRDKRAQSVKGGK